MAKKTRVLFVCMGNICRSPTAHASFRSLVEKQGLVDKIEIDSAGTHDYHIGKMPDARASQVAISRGIDMSDLQAREIKRQDLDIFDYVLVMDRDNKYMVEQVSDPHNVYKIKYFLEFARKDWGTLEVPDPYYGGDAGFVRVFDMVTDASQGLLEKIQQEQKL